MFSKYQYQLKRTMAYMIDCLLVFAVVMLIFQWLILTPLRGSIGIDEQWFHSSVNMHMYVVMTISLPVWVYFTYFDSNQSKGTIGKRILKLNVRNLDDMNRIVIKKSILRTLAKLLPWELAHIGVIYPEPLYFSKEPDLRILTIIGILLFMIYAFSIFTNKNGQSIYDKFLKVRVV